MARQARVFMIGWEYPPFNSGGLGVACEGITEALSQLNTQLYFTLPHSQISSVPHMQILPCVAPSWETASAQMQNLYGPGPFAAYATGSSDNRVVVSEAEAIDQHALTRLPQSELEAKVDQYADMVVQQGTRRNKAFDVIHAHDWMSFPAGVALAKATNKPLIAHVHSTEHDRIPSGTGSQYIHHVEYLGTQAATRVVAVSQYTKQLLVEKYALDPTKIDVVHNGIKELSNHSIEQQGFARNRPVVVFMGRLTAQKGAPYFLALASQVLRRLPEALFIVAGDGDMYHELLFSAAFQRLSASVLFSGFVRDTQRDKLLDRADVFVMPSLSEPFGLVALEAAQRHTPVIISKNAGVSEVLPSAISLDFWDLNKMADAIVAIVSNQALSRSLVNGQLHDVAQATWENTARRLKTVYSKAVGR